MKRGELIKALLKNMSFDRKRFIFFGLLFILAYGVFWVWRAQSYAAADVLYGENLPSTVQMDIVINKNGAARINGTLNRRVVSYYKEYDEFSLKIFDNPSQFINSYRGVVHLPSAGSEKNVRQIMYAVHGVGDTLYYMQDPQTLVYEATDIPPGATLTIVARLPKGMVNPPIWKKMTYTIERRTAKAWVYLAIALPSLTTLILLSIVFKRRGVGKFTVKGIFSQPPEKIPPAISGVLINGTIGGREIAATLVDLALRGYINIGENGEGEFNFGKRRIANLDTTPGLTDFEKALLSKIFLPEAYKSSVEDVEMRIGRHIFSRKIANFYVGIYNLATEKGYFIKNPSQVHLAYKYAGFGLLLFSFIGFMYGAIGNLDPKYALFFWIGGMIAALLTINFSPYMPALTTFGIGKAKDWLAFREYLASKDPIPPADYLGGKFFEYLPYAIVLDAEVEWAKRFKDKPFVVPDWYFSPESSTTLEQFASSLFPIIGYVSKNLARSHEPSVE